MKTPVSWLQKLYFFLITGGLYLGTIGFVCYVAIAASTPRTTISVKTPTVVTPLPKPESRKTAAPVFILISGKPVRLVIPDSGIDLPVDEGYYNEVNSTWTLSESHLQYATMTAAANNLSGNTFIYGHATNQVLGPLVQKSPVVGSIAHVYTNNGRIFTYTFQSSRSFTPDDTNIFNYNGPPIITVQTCTGSVSEWRTMYTFAFQKVTK